MTKRHQREQCVLCKKKINDSESMVWDGGRYFDGYAHYLCYETKLGNLHDSL